MVITFVGTGCGIPSKERGSPCILLSLGSENLLFDTGPGSLREIVKNGYSYNDFDYIFYTHFHVDHISDLAPIIFASKYPLFPRTRDLSIIGPESIRDFWEALLALYGSQIVPEHYEVKIMSVSQFKPKDWKVKTVKLPHKEESIGYRIEDHGKVFVYSGDTGYTERLVELGRGADALVLECSFPKPVEGHLYPDLAGKIASKCNTRLLILTHLYPVMEEDKIGAGIEKEFNGKYVVARDGMKIEI